MLELNKYFGEGVQALFTGSEINPFLNDHDPIFGEQVAAVLNDHEISTERVFNIRQVHQATVLNCRDLAVPARIEDVPEADGLVTDSTDVVLAIRTADCLPVFLYDPCQRVIGLIHAGWRSSQQGIARASIQMMIQEYGTDPKNVKAVFGPSIRSCCYEVGQELCMLFPGNVEPKEGKWFLDLHQINRDQLAQSGVRTEHIVDVKQCTCCNKDFFSYRRQGSEAGRHLSLMRLV